MAVVASGLLVDDGARVGSRFKTSIIGLYITSIRHTRDGDIR